MKTVISSFVLAVGLNMLSESVFGSESTGDFVITSFSVIENQGTLMWSGGRPTYQVQTRPNLTTDWVNVGNPTSNNIAIVPITNDGALFRVASDSTASYQVVF